MDNLPIAGFDGYGVWIKALGWVGRIVFSNEEVHQGGGSCLFVIGLEDHSQGWLPLMVQVQLHSSVKVDGTTLN